MHQILSKIKPTQVEEKELMRVASELVKFVEEKAVEEDRRISSRLVGSSSRGTWLKQEKDLDVFILFPVDYDKSRMEEIVTKIGRGILKKPHKRYAEHPYMKGWFSGYEVELVPCYAVRNASEIKSAVDRTPFHEEFVRKNLGGREDEVRLLKQFLKGIECYGAEAKTEGVSGYLAELLVIKYGSFKEVLKKASGWAVSVVIQIGSNFSEKELRSKFQAPMIFLDPVDSDRNVASALSLEKFNLFIYAAKEYLEKPSVRFFFPRKRSVDRDEVIEKFGKRKTSLIAVVFPKPNIVEDVLYPQMKKAEAAIVRLLESADFRVLDSSFFVRRNACIFVELESMNIPNAKLHLGPPVNSKHEAKFLKKHARNGRKLSEPFIRGRRWHIYIKRQFVDARVFLAEFIKRGHLEEKGIPSHVAKGLESKKSKLILNRAAISAEFASDVMERFKPTFPWAR